MSAEEYVSTNLTNSRERVLNFRTHSEDISPSREPDTQMQEESRPTPDAAPTGRKRPRLDLAALAGGGERKRGKSMFGVLVNTLNRAKAEDKERNASDAVCLNTQLLAKSLKR